MARGGGGAEDGDGVPQRPGELQGVREETEAALSLLLAAAAATAGALLEAPHGHGLTHLRPDPAELRGERRRGAGRLAGVGVASLGPRRRRSFGQRRDPPREPAHRGVGPRAAAAAADAALGGPPSLGGGCGGGGEVLMLLLLPLL